MRVSGRRWRMVMVGVLLTATAAACASSKPKTHVLGRVIERTTTTLVATTAGTDPTTTVSTEPPSTTPTTAVPAAAATTTTMRATTNATSPNTTAATTATTARATTTTAKPAPTSTTVSTVAGEALEPGAYLEREDGSEAIGIDAAGVVESVLIPPDVLYRDPTTFRTQFTVGFDPLSPLGTAAPSPRIVATVENTSGRAIALPGGLDMHLVCERSGAPWLDLHVADASITGITSGGRVSVTTTPVSLTLAGVYSCSATLPIVLL